MDFSSESTWLPPHGLVVGFQGLCVSLVACFLGFCCVPWLHKPARALLHDPVVYHVEGGLEWVLWAQKFSRPWLTTLFNWLSNTVGVPFYGSVLPLVAWLGLPQLSWRLILLMSLCLYVGNAIKDLVCAPRPLQVPYGKEKLKFLGGQSTDAEVNSKEYGLPSTHTMNSICLNFYVVHYLYDHGLISTYAAGVAYLVATLLVIVIASSRIYIGLHTPIDILAGAMAGLSVLICYIAVDDYIDSWILSGPQVILYQAVISLILLRLHPRPVAYTPSYEFSTSFMGVSFGEIVAVSRHHKRYRIAPIQLQQIWTHSPLWLGRRVVAGFIVLLLCKDVSRQVLLRALPVLYRFFPFVLRRLWQPPMHDMYTGKEEGGDPRLQELPRDQRGKAWDVVVTSRFFAYAGIGWAVFEAGPWLFDLLDW